MELVAKNGVVSMEVASGLVLSLQKWETLLYILLATETVAGKSFLLRLTTGLTLSLAKMATKTNWGRRFSIILWRVVGI